MNAIRGSLAHWYAQRMLQRKVEPIKVGIIANKQFPYEMTPEGMEIQSALLPKPLKEPFPFKFYFGLLVGIMLGVTLVLTGVQIFRAI